MGSTFRRNQVFTGAPTAGLHAQPGISGQAGAAAPATPSIPRVKAPVPITTAADFAARVLAGIGNQMPHHLGPGIRRALMLAAHRGTIHSDLEAAIARMDPAVAAKAREGLAEGRWVFLFDEP